MVKVTIRGVALTAALSVLALAGCNGGGGGGGSRGQSSTVAPTTSSNKPPTNTPPPGTVPAPVTSKTTPTGTGSALVASALMQQVSVFDLTTSTQKGSIATNSMPTAMAVNGTYAWVAGTDQTITCVDLLTNTTAYVMTATDAGITNLPLLGTQIDSIVAPLCRPTGVAVMPNGQKAFSANLINVTSYDLIGKKPLKSIFSLNLNLSLGGATGILQAITSSLQSFLAQPLAALGEARVACTNQTAFVTNTVTNNVTVISAPDDRVITYTPVGTLPIGVACANGKAYVTCAISNDIWVLDGLTGAVKTHFAGGQVPVDAAASPKGDRVYIANLLGGDITVVDTATDLPVNTLPAGISIAGIFQQLGVTLPASSAGSGGGISGLISTFLQGFLGGGGTTPGIGGLLGGSGPSMIGTIVNGLLSSFLSFAGISQQSLQGMNMPGIGVVGVSVTGDGKTVLGANLMFGLSVTDVATGNVGAPGLLTGSGIGADAVSASR